MGKKRKQRKAEKKRKKDLQILQDKGDAERRRKKHLQLLKDKSEDDYEQKITYISAGALGLSITFLSDIVDLEKSEHFWIVITAWILFAVTLISNLSSHLYSSYIMDVCADDSDDAQGLANWARRTKIIQWWNIANIISLTAGIIFFIIFICLNRNTMGNKKPEPANKPNTSIETYGRSPAKPQVKIDSTTKPPQDSTAKPKK